METTNDTEKICLFQDSGVDSSDTIYTIHNVMAASWVGTQRIHALPDNCYRIVYTLTAVTCEVPISVATLRETNGLPYLYCLSGHSSLSVCRAYTISLYNKSPELSKERKTINFYRLHVDDNKLFTTHRLTSLIYLDKIYLHSRTQNVTFVYRVTPNGNLRTAT